MVRLTAFLGHGTLQSRLLHPFDPSQSTIIAYVRILIRLLKNGFRIVVTAFWKIKPVQQQRQRTFTFQGIDACCLLPVSESCLVDAGAFFKMLMVSFKMSVSIRISCGCSFNCPGSFVSLKDPFANFSLGMSFSFISAGVPFWMCFLRQAYVPARLWPISSDADFKSSPSSKQRWIVSNFKATGGCRGCSGVLEPLVFFWRTVVVFYPLMKAASARISQCDDRGGDGSHRVIFF